MNRKCQTRLSSRSRVKACPTETAAQMQVGARAGTLKAPDLSSRLFPSYVRTKDLLQSDMHAHSLTDVLTCVPFVHAPVARALLWTVRLRDLPAGPGRLGSRARRPLSDPRFPGVTTFGTIGGMRGRGSASGRSGRAHNGTGVGARVGTVHRIRPSPGVRRRRPRVRRRMFQ